MGACRDGFKEHQLVAVWRRYSLAEEWGWGGRGALRCANRQWLGAGEGRGVGGSAGRTDVVGKGDDAGGEASSGERKALCCPPQEGLEVFPCTAAKTQAGPKANKRAVKNSLRSAG